LRYLLGYLQAHLLKFMCLYSSIGNDETKAQLAAPALLPAFADLFIMVFLGFPLPVAPPPSTKPAQEISTTVKKKKRVRLLSRGEAGEDEDAMRTAVAVGGRLISVNRHRFYGRVISFHG
jgi:hypothetical protein